MWCVAECDVDLRSVRFVQVAVELAWVQDLLQACLNAGLSRSPLRTWSAVCTVLCRCAQSLAGAAAATRRLRAGDLHKLQVLGGRGTHVFSGAAAAIPLAPPGWRRSSESATRILRTAGAVTNNPQIAVDSPASQAAEVVIFLSTTFPVAPMMPNPAPTAAAVMQYVVNRNRTSGDRFALDFDDSWAAYTLPLAQCCMTPRTQMLVSPSASLAQPFAPFWQKFHITCLEYIGQKIGRLAMVPYLSGDPVVLMAGDATVAQLAMLQRSKSAAIAVVQREVASHHELRALQTKELVTHVSGVNLWFADAVSRGRWATLNVVCAAALRLKYHVVRAESRVEAFMCGLAAAFIAAAALIQVALPSLLSTRRSNSSLRVVTFAPQAPPRAAGRRRARPPVSAEGRKGLLAARVGLLAASGSAAHAPLQPPWALAPVTDDDDAMLRLAADAAASDDVDEAAVTTQLVLRAATPPCTLRALRPPAAPLALAAPERGRRPQPARAVAAATRRAQAWEHVSNTFDFEKSATRLGMLMTVDGTDDDKIKIQGLDNYTFADEDGGEEAQESDQDGDDEDIQGREADVEIQEGGDDEEDIDKGDSSDDEEYENAGDSSDSDDDTAEPAGHSAHEHW
ncbi:hypothetical protein AB1Y20_002808 [Prymnesium parvum]|uniref:Uncharacterized protein n=1 Tax=Prymnesium parvum TaxID=97485 RepID=A0AB34J9N7_PRYPA